MKTLVLNLPMFGFVVATRAMVGVGIGLLQSERLPAERRAVRGTESLGNVIAMISRSCTKSCGETTVGLLTLSA